jgi:hypothetical protein
MDELQADHQANLDAGIVERCGAATFVAPRFVVRPRLQRNRVVYDLRLQNGYLKPVFFPTPTFADALHRLPGAQVFSKLDLKGGYHQVEVDARDRWLQCYAQDGELWQLKRLSMGLACSPALFQQCMTHILRPCLAFVVIYLDDVLIFSRDHAEHASHVKQALDCLRAHNVQLSEGKCEWGVECVSFLGRTLSHGKVQHDENHLSPVFDAPLPDNLQELRRWLGCINFICSHMVGLAPRLHPLFQLVGELGKKKVKKKAIPWTDELRQAFYAAQEWLRQHYRPLLIPNTSAPYRLYCDASRSGMGAALLQLCPATQRWEPVEFYSKQWQCPKAYGVRELELKALHDAVRHWRHLLRYGQHVQVYSDHQSLSYKIDPVSNTSCAPVDGWVAFLSRYKMTVTYVKGENNTVADYLSRSAAGGGQANVTLPPVLGHSQK